MHLHVTHNKYSGAHFLKKQHNLGYSVQKLKLINSNKAWSEGYFKLSGLTGRTPDWLYVPDKQLRIDFIFILNRIEERTTRSLPWFLQYYLTEPRSA